ESYFGFKAFGNLLEAAQQRGLLQFGRDDKSGAYVYRQNGRADADDELGDEFEAPVVEAAAQAAARPATAGRDGKDSPREGKEGRERRQGRRREGGRDAGSRGEAATPDVESQAPQ